MINFTTTGCHCWWTFRFNFKNKTYKTFMFVFHGRMYQIAPFPLFSIGIGPFTSSYHLKLNEFCLNINLNTAWLKTILTKQIVSEFEFGRKWLLKSVTLKLMHIDISSHVAQICFYMFSKSHVNIPRNQQGRTIFKHNFLKFQQIICHIYIYITFQKKIYKERNRKSSNLKHHD